MASIIDNADGLNEIIFEKIKVCNEQLITATQTPAEALIIENFLVKYPLSVILNAIAAENMNVVEANKQKARVKLVTELLNRILFNKCNITVISPNLSGTMDYLIAGLQSPFTEIQVLSLKVLNEVFAKATKDAETGTMDTYKPDPRFIPHLTNLLSHDDIELGKELVSVLSKYGQNSTPPDRKELLLKLVEFFHANPMDESVAHVRIIDIVIKISKLQHRFQQCIDTGAIQLIETLLLGDDILVQMNVLEIAKALAATPHGAEFFLQNNTCDKLFQILGVSFGGNDSNEEEEAVVEPLLWSGAIELLGYVCTTQLQEEDLKDEKLVKTRNNKIAIFMIAAVTIMRNYSSDDEQLAMIALHVIRHFLQESYDNAWVVYTHHTCMEIIFTWTACANNDFRALAFHTLADIVRVAKLNSERGKLVYDRIGANSGIGNTIDGLLGHISKPFVETKHGVLDLLSAMLETVWGVRILLSYKQFEDYLLDTRAESTYVSKQWKFVMLQNLRSNVDGWNLLREEVKEALLTVLKNGPYYTMAAAAQIKTEEA
jgi:hypothetical protein